jgi:hypothetical protein
MTSALDEGEWSASRPGRTLPLEKGSPIPIGQKAGWAPEPVWTQRLEEKSFASVGDRTSIVRSSSAYSDTTLAEVPRLQNIYNIEHKFQIKVTDIYDTYILYSVYQSIRI